MRTIGRFKTEKIVNGFECDLYELQFYQNSFKENFCAISILLFLSMTVVELLFILVMGYSLWDWLLLDPPWRWVYIGRFATKQEAVNEAKGIEEEEKAKRIEIEHW